MADVFQYLPASERVAQLVEHVTFNHGVVGSSPTALTTLKSLMIIKKASRLRGLNKLLG
jgi:hypothetical protein